MAGSAIEAKLRLILERADAVAGLREFRRELKATKADAEASSPASAAAGDLQQVQQAINLAKQRGQAEREAAAEAKRLAKEKRDAERAAAKEAEELAKKERERKRKEKQEAAAAEKDRRREAAKAAQLAPQLTDITVGLATGQNPLMVALQQGGQLRDIYGGFGNALRALMSVVTPARVLIGGLAAGFGLLAVNAIAGWRETQKLTKELALAGNASGITAGQVTAGARAIAQQQGASIGFVRDVLQQLASVQGQTDTTLLATGRAVTALAKLNGSSAEEAVKNFADQAAGVTDWATKANKAYNFLTADQVQYIKALERQGRVSEAIKFTNDQLADSLVQRAGPAIGLVERAWNAAAAAVSRFIDQIKEVGRDKTPEQRLAELQAKQAEIDARLAQRANTGRRRSTELADREAAASEIEQVNRRLIRQAEERIEKTQQQDEILKKSAEFQAAIAQKSLAEAQKALAERNAELDKEQEIVERAYAQQVDSAQTRALELNRIEQLRLRAAAAMAAQELDIEQKRAKEASKTPLDVEQALAAETALKARLTDAQARIEASAAEGRRLVDAEVSRLRDEVNRRAAENSLTNAAREVTDPAERARRVAEAATSEARRQVRELQTELDSLRELSLPSDQRERQLPLLERQLAEARRNLLELTRSTELTDLFKQSEEALTKLANAEQRLDQLTEQGAIATTDAEKQKLALRQQTLEQLGRIDALLSKIAQGPDETNRLNALKNKLGELRDVSTEFDKTLRSSLKDGFAGFFKDVVTGSSSALQAFKKFVSSVASSMLDLIAKRLGEKLVNSLLGSTTGGGGALDSILPSLRSVFSFHTGGVVGAGAAAARLVSPLVFAGAQVMHTGGIAGLRSGEVPAILQAGEEVLTAKDPRHVRNLGAAGVVFSMQVNISGAAGAEADQRDSIADLDRRVRGQIEQWAADQRRQGGILAGRSGRG